MPVRGNKTQSEGGVQDVNDMFDKIQKHSLTQKVCSFIANERMLEGIDHIDVALSGGADSVCLLAVLCALKRTCDSFTLRAHHIRHHLREDDLHDAATASCLAELLKVPYIQTELDWKTKGKPESNIEEKARDARYEALFDALKQREISETTPDVCEGCMPPMRHSPKRPTYAAESRIDGLKSVHQAIALAHHGDENVETMLWRLGRGCGLEGLCLAPRRTQNHVALMRPLLCVSKDDIYHFLNDVGLPWAEDPTNFTDKYRRNRIRQHILPAIRAEAMSDACLYRSLIQIRRDADAMTSFAQYFVENQPFWQNAWFCPWAAWHTLELGAQAQVLRHAARVVVPGCCPDGAFITQTLDMIKKRAQTHRQTRQAQIVVAWSNGGLMIYPNSEMPAPQNLFLSIPCQNVDIWQLCRISAWYQSLETVPANTKSMLHIDAEAVHGELKIRPACDFPRLLTAVGNLCKTREALRSQGVPDYWRQFWPILCDEFRPLWVLGGMRTLTAIPPKPGHRALSITIEWKKS